VPATLALKAASERSGAVSTPRRIRRNPGITAPRVRRERLIHRRSRDRCAEQLFDLVDEWCARMDESQLEKEA